MRNHTLGPSICYRAVLAQGLAHLGGSDGFLRAGASPNGAEQLSCVSTDTQRPVTLAQTPDPYTVPGQQLSIPAPRPPHSLAPA